MGCPMTWKLVLPIAALLLASPAIADDAKPAKGEVDAKKTVKLEGQLACTKCKLNETEACGHALLVKEKKDGKEVEIKYYINDNGAKEDYHGAICTAPKPAVVTAKLGEEKDKDGKPRKVLTEAKVVVK